MELPSYQYCPTCQSGLFENKLGYLECSSDVCSFTHYSNPTPVVGAIVEYGENQMLLGHNRLWPKNWFAILTGFVEKHELPEETVIREVKEEVGLDAELVSFVGHYMFKKMNQLIIVYHLKANGEIILEDEIDEIKLVPFDKVKYWPLGTGLAVRDFLLRKGYQPEALQKS